MLHGVLEKMRIGFGNGDSCEIMVYVKMLHEIHLSEI